MAAVQPEALAPGPDLTNQEQMLDCCEARDYQCYVEYTVTTLEESPAD
jgi:hypothetical protein